MSQYVKKYFLVECLCALLLAMMTNLMFAQENGEMTWDSYVENSAEGDVAGDVTNGIRIEDIVEKPYEYRYAAFGKGDPFEPPMLSTESDNSNALLEIPIVSVLQKYPTNQLKLVGWWELKTGERKAFIMTPKDEGVVTLVGDVIGNKGGKVISIGDGEVTIREFTLARDGTREFSDVTINAKGQEDDKEKEKDKIVIKANSAEDEGYTQEELLPKGLLDKDADIVAREAAARRDIVVPADELNQNAKVEAIDQQIIGNAAGEGEVVEIQDEINQQ